MSNRALHGIGDWALICDSDDEMDDQATTPLSFGSDMHESGRCKPCTHFHRPEGCAHGDTCRFCHSCPPGEKQRRKHDRRREVGQRNAKIYANARNETPSIVPVDTSSTHESVADPLNTASPAALGLEDNSEAGYGIGTMDFVVCTFASDVINPHNERDDQATTTLSCGSDMHASGQCKPCTHFHRPEGCAHGDTCRFCHSCLPGEKQRRKRDRRREVKQHQNKKSMNVPSSDASTECSPRSLFSSATEKEFSVISVV